MEGVIMAVKQLTNRQLAALLIFEKESQIGDIKITPSQCAEFLDINGADATRIARRLLDQLERKGFVKKALFNGGLNRGTFAQYWLSQPGKEFLVHYLTKSSTMSAMNSQLRYSCANSDRLGTIYFIGNVNSGPVKIGFTSSEDPSLRLRSLQTASPTELSILGYTNGTFDIEKRIHAFLHIHRLKGEWFERDAALSVLGHLMPQSLAKQAVGENALSDAACSIVNHLETEVDDDLESLAIVTIKHLLWDFASSFRAYRTNEPLPFLSWLLNQVGRDDATGDLAVSAKSDLSFPRVGSLEDYLDYLYGRLFPELTRTVVYAWIECQQAIIQLNSFA